jgi:hypothetical protein
LDVSLGEFAFAAQVFEDALQLFRQIFEHA